MKFLTVGTNFDYRQLDFFIKCNEQYDEVKIDKVYGSLRTDKINLPSARPDFRLGNSDRKVLESFVKTAKNNNICVDYTVNALLNMPVEELYSKKQEIIDLFRYLESIGVERIIAANPLIMELITEYTGLKIKCSTILGIDRVSAIKHYSKYRVDYICPDIYINRNISLLAEMNKACQKYGMNLELLANEICIFGDAPCSNVLRTNCYLHSSFGGNPNNRFDSWPFSRCQKARQDYPESILKIPFILPNHMNYYYNNCCIKYFKVSGRTNTFEYLTYVVEKYLSQEFDESIENLFMLPQNTKHAANKSINYKTLEENGFFERILNPANPCDYQCHKCRYCENFYEKL